MYSPPFPSHKDLHITKHTDQLIKILQDKQIPVEKVIKVLKEQLTIEQEARLKALAKEKAKEKCKSTESSTNQFMPTHDVNNTRLDAMSLHKVVLKNQISHSTPKTDIFDIVICNISLDSSTRHWDQTKLNHMMGFTNPSCRGKSHVIFKFIFT
jgi:hypothetical protein